jgi:hypothetical protein
VAVAPSERAEHAPLSDDDHRLEVTVERIAGSGA